MKDKFLTILTDGTEFYAPEISTKDEVEARQRKADEATDGTFNVISIPLATVLASPKVLAASQKAADVLMSAAPYLGGRDQSAHDAITNAVKQAECGCRSAISEATEGGAAASLPRPSAETKPSPFTVCAFKPQGFEYPVLQVFWNDTPVSVVFERDDIAYSELRKSAGGDQNIKWLYGQEPQPLE